jgi:plasmid stability protein
MDITITLPNHIEAPLKRKAEEQHRSIKDVVLDILGTVLKAEEDVFPTPEAVVAKIKATPPNPQCIHPASGSLAEALRNATDDPDFDLAQWTQEWEAVEQEMKAITRANNIAEGRE